MKNILLATLMLISLSLLAQEKLPFEAKELETFNIEKFKQNKDKQGWMNDYYYVLGDQYEVREYEITHEGQTLKPIIVKLEKSSAHLISFILIIMMAG